MLIGHYGPSFAGKAIERTIPLWVLFIAVQLLDVFWSIFVLLGIEKVRIVPGITKTNPFDLYYMPYTHSLPAALAWALAAGLAWALIRKAQGWQGPAVVSGAVFSHWILDLIVHRPDLPLYGNSFKVGLGLWNFPAIAFLLELAFVFGGMVLYLRTTRSLNRLGRYGFVVFGLLMGGVQAMVFFGPGLGSGQATAVFALTLYIVFAAVAYWLERQRVPKPAHEPVPSPAS
jgi:hypothetical protein